MFDAYRGANCDGLTDVSAANSCKAEFEAVQIIGRAVVWIAVLFDGAKQFPHRSVEP